MSSIAENEELLRILADLEDIHIPSGPLYQEIKRRRVLLTLTHNELEGIYHLTESHAPGLRFNATVQYDKALITDEKAATINKENVKFSCATVDLKHKINSMLRNVREMPKEWTVVQLTPEFNQDESFEFSGDKVYTNPIYVSVFNCGEGSGDPYCVRVNAPFDKIANKTIEVCAEMKDIIRENKLLISSVQCTKEGRFRHYHDKKVYMEARDLVNCRLMNVVKEMQWNWLKEFRCLLISKLFDEALEKEVATVTDNFFKDIFGTITRKQNAIMQCLIKGFGYLKFNEYKKLVVELFPNATKEEQTKVIKFARDLNENLKLHEAKRHPLILIVDEKLDFLPWELIDVLENHPVTRMPSLHFTYALFKEHESTIENGLKIISDPHNSAYVLNPTMDLKQMELRMNSFFQNYFIEWRSLVGEKPTPEQFAEFLTDFSIFSYHGHGNGAQFLSGDKIQKLRVKAVALLFGCSSVTLTSLGPQVEMIGQHHTYLIACSPCVVGMLYTVSDMDTDIITTEFLSRWIKSKAICPWKCVNKKIWLYECGAINPSSTQKQSVKEENEPELLRALCRAKKEARHYITTASCVSRGLPIKIRNQL